MVYVGTAYLNRILIDSNANDKAIKLMLAAANQDNARALYLLGNWYRQGASIPPNLQKDYAKAFHFLERSTVVS